MRKSLILVFLLLFSGNACALGIGVVPDRLVFDGDAAETAIIINPNNVTIEYMIQNQNIICEPSEGSIGPESQATVTCTALDGAQDGMILVETKGSDGSVGVIPAVAIKAEVAGSSAEEPAEEYSDNGNESSDTGRKTKDSPLMISGESAAGDEERGDHHQAGILTEMKAEMITIALLTAAILFVLAYSAVKERKKEKKESGEEPSNDATGASSISASQDGLSSASASASPHQPS